jgi:hypothetical protein
LVNIDWNREAMRLAFVQQRIGNQGQEESIKVYLVPPNITAQAQRGFLSLLHMSWLDDEFDIEMALNGVPTS